MFENHRLDSARANSRLSLGGQDSQRKVLILTLACALLGACTIASGPETDRNAATEKPLKPATTAPTGATSAFPGPAAAPPTRSPSPTAIPTSDVAGDEPDDPTDWAPVLEMGCPAPYLDFADQGTLGATYIFEPNAKVSFAGTEARLVLSVDGWESRTTTITTDVSARVLEPVDLSHRFYNTRTDEDRYNGVGREKEHIVSAVLIDQQGREARQTCIFTLLYP